MRKKDHVKAFVCPLFAGCAVVLYQLSCLTDGPKAICGDLNANAVALPTLEDMIRTKGWVDIGDDQVACA